MSREYSEGENWFGVQAAPALSWRLKHKPVIVEMDDGTTFVQIHPEDAHLFAEEPE